MPALNFSRGVDDEQLSRKYNTPDPVSHDTQDSNTAYEKAYRTRLAATGNWMPTETYLSRPYNVYNLSPLSKLTYTVAASDISRRSGPAVIAPAINFRELEVSLKNFISSRHYVPKQLIEVQLNLGIPHALPGTIVIYVVCPSLIAADGTSVLTAGDMQVSYNVNPQSEEEVWTEKKKARAMRALERFTEDQRRKQAREDRLNRSQEDNSDRRKRNTRVERRIEAQMKEWLPDKPTLEEKYPARTSVFALLPRHNAFERDPKDDPTKSKWPILLEGAADNQVVQIVKEWMGWRLNAVWSQHDLHVNHEIVDSFAENTWWYSELHDVRPQRPHEFSICWSPPLESDDIKELDITIPQAQVQKLARSYRGDQPDEEDVPRLLPRIKEVLIRNTGLQLDKWIPTKATVLGITIDFSQKKKIKINPAVQVSRDNDWDNEKETLEEFRMANVFRWLVTAFAQGKKQAELDYFWSTKHPDLDERPRVIKHEPGVRERHGFKKPKGVGEDLKPKSSSSRRKSKTAEQGAAASAEKGVAGTSKQGKARQDTRTSESTSPSKRNPQVLKITAIAMDGAIARIEQACRQFSHPATRQQGENELLAINEALSPSDIPAFTTAVLHHSQEYYAHFHLLTLLISTLSPQSNPELSQHLLNYILSDKKVPVYVSVKAHLALVKASSLEHLVLILNNIKDSSPAAAVGLSRAILEEQHINLDEDNEPQTKSFEDNVLPLLSNVVLQSLSLSHDNDVMKYTVPALEALLTYRNDQNDLIYNTATDSMHISVLNQLARPEVLQLIVSVNTHENETLGFMIRKVLNAIFSSSHPSNKDEWTLSLMQYLDGADSLDISTKLSCHKSLLQSRNLDVILSNKGEEYINKLFQLGSASLSQSGEAFADFLACWLSILGALESNRVAVPKEMCTQVAEGWLDIKASPLDNTQEDAEDELDDVETEMKVILEPLAQLSRMNSLPILATVTNKMNTYNTIIETSGCLSDSNYDRLQTLVLFAGTLIADEGIGETPMIPSQILADEQVVSGLASLVGTMAKLTMLFSSSIDLSPNVAGIIWKSFWARYLRSYGLTQSLSLHSLQAINNAGFYNDLQKVIEHSLLKWKSEEDVIDGLADTIQCLPLLPAMIDYGRIIDIVLSNMQDWPYRLDKKLVRSCGTYISKMDRTSDHTNRYKSRILYFISNMFKVIDDPGFVANSQRHPYITNVKMGLNALVGLSETLDPYTYLETVYFIKDVSSQLIPVVQQHYKARIDIQMDILLIFYSVIHNMDLGLDFDEATMRTLPQTHVSPILNMWFEYYMSLKFERGMDDSDEFSEGVEAITKLLRDLASVDGNSSDVNNDKNFSTFVVTYLNPIFNVSQTILPSNLALQSESIGLICSLLRSYPHTVNTHLSMSGDNFFNVTLLNTFNQSITSQWNASYALIDGIESYLKHSADKRNGANVLSQIIAIPLNAILMRLVTSRTLKQRMLKFLHTILNREDTHLWLNRNLILSTITTNLGCPESSKAAVNASLQSALMPGLDLPTYRTVLNELCTHIANLRRSS
ncbi:hypothetical protein E3P99_03765 [Wallemia hederae]|uniref:Uncharacterized protein n=1 Tax=Wallemia hederae TaxID=1540922 RepID=A0A4T0FG51_9BASI|nr:hypothetical protein E3P99_03765 [Wallemia hederae]